MPLSSRPHLRTGWPLATETDALSSYGNPSLGNPMTISPFTRFARATLGTRSNETRLKPPKWLSVIVSYACVSLVHQVCERCRDDSRALPHGPLRQVPAEGGPYGQGREADGARAHRERLRGQGHRAGRAVRVGRKRWESKEG